MYIAVTAQRKSDPWSERNMSTPSGGLLFKALPRGIKTIVAALVEEFEYLWPTIEYSDVENEKSRNVDVTAVIEKEKDAEPYMCSR